MWMIPILVALTEALITPAFAHVGFSQTNSFVDGIAHPLNGLDHVLAMTAVGLWAVPVGGRAIWVWPMSFVAVMLAGFASATFGLKIAFVEPAVWSSIIVLGLFVALAVPAPLWLGAALIGLSAFFHGHAHGTEAHGTEAQAANLVPYAIGFAFATAGLNVFGIGLGLSARGSIGKAALRTAGGFAVLVGISLMVS
jgi:urease accessory protein